MWPFGEAQKKSLKEHQIPSRAEPWLEENESDFSHSLHLIEMKKGGGGYYIAIAGPENTGRDCVPRQSWIQSESFSLLTLFRVWWQVETAPLFCPELLCTTAACGLWRQRCVVHLRCLRSSCRPQTDFEGKWHLSHHSSVPPAKTWEAEWAHLCVDKLQ